MKRYLLLSLLVGAMTFTSCAQSKKSQTAPAKVTTEQKATPVAQKGNTIVMTTEMFRTKVIDYRTNNKEWNYLGDKPCLIDFHATWCGPCKKLGPILEELGGEYKGKMYIYKVDIDQEPELAQLFGIRSVPTMLLVPMKGQPQVVQGLLPKANLKEAIDQVLFTK